jgi:hypothetical protein
MVRNNYLDPNKVTVAEWVDKALLQYLKKIIIKSGFKVYRILATKSCNYGWKVWSE